MITVRVLWASGFLLVNRAISPEISDWWESSPCDEFAVAALDVSPRSAAGWRALLCGLDLRAVDVGIPLEIRDRTPASAPTGSSDPDRLLAEATVHFAAPDGFVDFYGANIRASAGEVLAPAFVLALREALGGLGLMRGPSAEPPGDVTATGHHRQIHRFAAGRDFPRALGDPAVREALAGLSEKPADEGRRRTLLAEADGAISPEPPLLFTPEVYQPAVLEHLLVFRAGENRYALIGDPEDARLLRRDPDLARTLAQGLAPRCGGRAEATLETLDAAADLHVLRLDVRVA